MLSHYDSLQTYSIYENDRMILHEKDLSFIAGGIKFSRLFENVIYRPKSIFSTIPQYCLDQSLLFILLQFCIKY